MKSKADRAENIASLLSEKGVEIFTPDEREAENKKEYFRQMDRDSQFHSHGLEFCEASYNTFVMFRIVYTEEVRPERIR